MTAPVCDCPVVPDLSDATAEQLDRIVGRPHRCASCGQELELRCPEGHVHQAPKTHSPNVRPKATVDAGPRRRESKPRTYKPKLCACGETFTPTGPRDIRCPGCKGRVAVP